MNKQQRKAARQATDVQATDVQAYTDANGETQYRPVQATDVQATDVQATDVQATDVQATDVQATDVQASTEQAAPVARIYTFRAYHSRGTMWVSFVSAGGGNVVAECNHFATLPQAGDVLALSVTSANVPGHTLTYAGVTKAGRFTYKLAGHKGVWTLYASQMPAGSVIDGMAAPFLHCSLLLQGGPAIVQAASTTAAVIAGANMAHTTEVGATVQPSDIASVQAALGVKAVSE